MSTSVVKSQKSDSIAIYVGLDNGRIISYHPNTIQMDV
jgi:hypothetical protein